MSAHQTSMTRRYQELTLHGPGDALMGTLRIARPVPRTTRVLFPLQPATILCLPTLKALPGVTCRDALLSF